MSTGRTLDFSPLHLPLYPISTNISTLHSLPMSKSQSSFYNPFIKDLKDIQIGNEEIKQFLFADDMFFYGKKNPKVSIKLPD